MQKLELSLTVTPSDCTNNIVLAVDFIAKGSGLSKQKIKSAMLKGCIWLTRGKTTQRLRRAKKDLKAGDVIDIYYNEKVLTDDYPEPILISDEGEYSVWNKPSGLLSQGSKWGDHATVARIAETQLKPQRTAFIIHRLDRAASGLILIGHSKKATASLSAMFQQRALTKIYQAKINGRLNQSEITVTEPIDEPTAVSHVKELAFNGEQSLVQITIESGRKHQIRRHLAFLGHPIVGDRLYGNSSTADEDLCLTAVSLSFECPISKTIKAFQVEPQFLLQA